jgi:hypothetical protein
VTAIAGGTRRDGLWAITCYFNPMRSERRLENYRVFRRRVTVPLVAVELAYGPGFELEDGDADVLIRLRGRDVMWQKERLLTVALSSLPGECRKVVWMDCDVMFEADDWSERLDVLLDRVPLVQAFSHVHHLSRDGTQDETSASTLFTQPSAVRTIASGTPAAEVFARRISRGPGSTSKGMVWAARRHLLDQNGFYDACIIGGGDLALIAAVYGCFDVAVRNMNDMQSDHYMAWARQWHDMLSGEIGFLDGRLLHLWHGEIDDRRYRERHDGLRPYDFDPFVDIALDDNRSWRWNSDKPDLHAYVKTYFASRREDGDR